MLNSEDKELTDMARFFLEPSNPTHRQYEALRAYFVDHLPSAEAARRFGYTPGEFSSSLPRVSPESETGVFPASHEKPKGSTA